MNVESLQLLTCGWDFATGFGAKILREYFGDNDEDYDDMGET